MPIMTIRPGMAIIAIVIITSITIADSKETTGLISRAGPSTTHAMKTNVMSAHTRAAETKAAETRAGGTRVAETRVAVTMTTVAVTITEINDHID